MSSPQNKSTLQVRVPNRFRGRLRYDLLPKAEATEPAVSTTANAQRGSLRRVSTERFASASSTVRFARHASVRSSKMLMTVPHFSSTAVHPNSNSSPPSSPPNEPVITSSANGSNGNSANATVKKKNNLEEVKWFQHRWLDKHGKPSDLKETREKMVLLRKWFESLDTDGSGEVGLNELEDPLVSVGLARSREDVRKLIEQVDQNGKGEVSFNEFLVLMNPKQPQQKLPRTSRERLLYHPRPPSALPPSTVGCKSSSSSMRLGSPPGSGFKRAPRTAPARLANSPLSDEEQAQDTSPPLQNEPSSPPATASGTPISPRTADPSAPSQQQQQQQHHHQSQQHQLLQHKRQHRELKTHGSPREPSPVPEASKARQKSPSKRKGASQAHADQYSNPVVKLFADLQSGKLGDLAIPFPNLITAYRRRMLLNAHMAEDPTTRKLGTSVLQALESTRREASEQVPDGEIDSNAGNRMLVNGFLGGGLGGTTSRGSTTRLSALNFQLCRELKRLASQRKSALNLTTSPTRRSSIMSLTAGTAPHGQASISSSSTTGQRHSSITGTTASSSSAPRHSVLVASPPAALPVLR